MHNDNKVEKNNKKVLTKPEQYAILIELSTRRALRKNLKKVLEKVLTRARRCDIIIESPRKATAKQSQEWSLKIEQQEIRKYKEK